MTTNVMQGFRERIASREWLDEETKKRATRKVGLSSSLEVACFAALLPSLCRKFILPLAVPLLTIYEAYIML